MPDNNINNKFDDYFLHLQKITFVGRIYKKFFTSPILFLCARRFGRDIVEIGSGTGNGILGAFSKRVRGLEINPISVEYCKKTGLNVDLIQADKSYPIADATIDACVLDNVLEHIEDAKFTLDECYRIIKKNGGLIIAVPGLRGFESDADHKQFYGINELTHLDGRWQLLGIFSTPFIFKSESLSNSIKQYCLVASYRKL
ncbi:MAG: class I SAM-dependent methyltransferase [Methylotenera sp.]|nr:class I SAM-dependent methyltransferase [Methylotenera sp.]